MNATVLSALADSALFPVGNRLFLVEAFQPIPIGQDDDAHVDAMEEWYSRCFCCCCTGECSSSGEYEFSFEDSLFEGFVEGDLEGSLPFQAW